MDYQQDEHRVYLIVHRPVWTPKRRKPVLVGDMAADCRRLIEQKCAERGWKVLEPAVNPDHVHEPRRNYPVLRKLPSLWIRSYFAATAGNVSSETIQQYIAAQKGR